jgi:hypothetical protein
MWRAEIALLVALPNKSAEEKFSLTMCNLIASYTSSPLQVEFLFL